MSKAISGIGKKLFGGGGGGASAPRPTSPASRANAAMGTPLFRRPQSTIVSQGRGSANSEKKMLGSGLFLG